MNVQQYLKDRNVAYEVLPHGPTYEAQAMAGVLHVPGRMVAKTVYLVANHGFKPVLVVLPATRHVDLAAISRAMGNCEVRLASEQELAELCPDCEVGALPPFGSRYGMTTLVAEELTTVDEIVFEGNTHAESIRMKYADYYQLEHPLVLAHCTQC